MPTPPKPWEIVPMISKKDDKPAAFEADLEEPIAEENSVPPLDTADPGMLQMLVEWNDLVRQLAYTRAREMELRKVIGVYFFRDPKEGVNTVQLPDGWLLKLDHRLTRSIDEAALAAVLKKLPKGTEQRLVRYKPELALAAYRKMHPKQRLIFDEALIIKPGSPAIKLVAPPAEPEKKSDE